MVENEGKLSGLRSKGGIVTGYDVDVVLLDPHESYTVRAEESESVQGYTPFEGFTLKGKVKTTFLRGNMIYDKDKVKGKAKGQYQSKKASL